MSLITSCPTCATMFRVVPDQLKISEGWVRCGHCSEIFDATAYLADESALQGAPDDGATRPADMATTPADLMTRPADLGSSAAGPLGARSSGFGAEPSTMPVDLPTRPAELASRPGALPTRDLDVPPLGLPRSGAAQRAQVADRAGPASSSFGPDSESLQPSSLDGPFVFRRSDLVADAPDESIQPPVPRDSGFRVAEEPDAEAGDDVSFVRHARRKAFWRRPLVRIVLVLASLALSALLVLQLAWQDRDRLALSEPALRPLLQQMCAVLHCTLGAPRQIDAIVIENSGFNRLRNDTYRLSFTLRNTAHFPVALPAMELTVTDAQDQPIARRVLTPAELGVADGAISAGTDWSRSVGIVLDTPPAARVAGYRLLAFYP